MDKFTVKTFELYDFVSNSNSLKRRIYLLFSFKFSLFSFIFGIKIKNADLSLKFFIFGKKFFESFLKNTIFTFLNDPKNLH